LSSYVAVVGKRAFWQSDDLSERESVVRDDALRSSSVVVEASDLHVHWMEPRDLFIDVASPELEWSTQYRIPHSGGDVLHDKVPWGLNVLLANGSVQLIGTSGLTAGRLNELLAVGGLSNDAIVELSRKRAVDEPINWAGCLAVFVLVVVVTAVVCQTVRACAGPSSLRVGKCGV
jgi:hypothetical protein